MITLNVPEGAPTYIEGVSGKLDEKFPVYVATQYKGRNVIDLPKALFIQQLQGGHGLHWERLNPRAIQFLAETGGNYYGNPFPDEDYVPPKPAAKVVETFMVTLKAPDGVTHYSHGGQEYVAEGGLITVTDDVANTLRCHGFRDVA